MIDALGFMPLNFALLYLSAEDVQGTRKIATNDIFEGMSRNFHPDGLFSVATFGKAGEDRRDRTFSYIDLNIPILHPLIFKTILDLKALYGDIMSGRAYAIFDKEQKDFVKSDAENGQTGYAFFLKHYRSIDFKRTDSNQRDYYIELVNQDKKHPLMDKLVVMPAGLRDYVIDDNGKPSEDEINGLYRRVFSITSLLENVNPDLNPEHVDASRFQLQIAVLDIYNYIIGLLDGKNKLIYGKWASRKVYDSTRNVITSYVSTATHSTSLKNLKANETAIGLYQYSRMIMPLSVKYIRDGFLSKVFVGPNAPAHMVNKKTLKKEPVNIPNELYDEWMTYEGIEKTLSKFAEEDLRHDYLETSTHYFGLIYQDSKCYKLLQDIDELPDGFDKKNVRPLSFAELLYVSLYKDARETPCFITRYPITGYGSIYPSYCYLKSTNKSLELRELDDNWQETDCIGFEFPIPQESFFNAMSPHPSHLERLGADYDGDMCSAVAVLSEDARAEIKKLLSSKMYYVGADGKMSFTVKDQVIDLMMACTTA